MDALLNIEPREDFENATEETLLTLYSSGMTPSTDVIKAAKDELKHLFRINNFDITKVSEALHIKEADLDKINFLIRKLNEQKIKLLYSALIDYNTSYGECMTDFDWALKLVLGTSELKTLRYPFLQLVLSSTSSDATKKTVYNMKKDVLAKIIYALENVK